MCDTPYCGLLQRQHDNTVHNLTVDTNKYTSGQMTNFARSVVNLGPRTTKLSYGKMILHCVTFETSVLQNMWTVICNLLKERK